MHKNMTVPHVVPSFPVDGYHLSFVVLLRQLKILTGKLDACCIMTIGRRDCVHPVTFRALADKRCQREVSAASLAPGRQTAVGYQLISYHAAMGIINKLDKFAADRKWAAASATTISHI